MIVIRPQKIYFNPCHNKVPLIFLAGPIMNAPAWHEEAIEIIAGMMPDCLIACPKRLDKAKKEFAVRQYNAQVDWETKWLLLSSYRGGILFWLPLPERKSTRPYAQTTRFELGKWSTVYENNRKYPLSVGIEHGFPGERYLRRRLKQTCDGVIVRSSLKETCKDMVERLRKEGRYHGRN